MSWFINYYQCPGNLDYRKAHKAIEWQNEADCTCNDKCELCNAELTPIDSTEIAPEDMEAS